MSLKNYHAIPLGNIAEPDYINDNEAVNPRSCFGKRHTQMCLYTICTFLISSAKVYMSFAVLAMTDPNVTSNKDIPTYNWSDKNLILSSFFWGFCLPQIFAGWLTASYNPKWIMISTMAVCAFSGFLIPEVAASVGSKGVLVCRFIQGFSLGFQASSLYSLYGKWIPIYERSRFISFIYAGSTLGVVCSMFLSGKLAASTYGWPSIMYLHSFGATLWCISFAVFGFNNPNDHPSITVEEIMDIQDSINNQDKIQDLSTPWKKIFTSASFLALLLCQCGYSYGYYVFLTEIPSYLKNIVKLNIETNGITSALPYILAILLSYGLGYVADNLIKNETCTVNIVRKLFLSIGCIIFGITLLFIIYYGSHGLVIVIILFTIGVSTDLAANINSITVNYIDLAPNHAGTLIGIANQFALPFGALAPLTLHFLISDETNIDQWKRIFFLTLSFKALTVLIFLIFGSGKVQSWNDEIKKTITDNIQNDIEDEV